MNHKLPPLPVRIVVVLIVIAAILYFTIGNSKADDGQLKASGTIESVTVNVSPEMAGKVKDV
ncbi:MAG TPA: hypothetical protein VN843_19815, partial [Anaerolineales bacterium]|nr:hypothetical protein [Anaerolineales bacterium]